MPRKKKPKSNRANSNTLRIIGGDWRSRKLSFGDAEGLRPTPDRVRETLFNWLQGQVHGANCLDLFAGSGALGIEALSRRASNVIFVEKNRSVASQLEANLKLLHSGATVVQSDALNYLTTCDEGTVFDLIFLDPPYRKDLIKPSLDAIFHRGLLAKSGLIYLEHESEEQYDWSEYLLKTLKETHAGQVKSFLLQIS